jgi:hypothetical protein
MQRVWSKIDPSVGAGGQFFLTSPVNFSVNGKKKPETE